MFRLKRRLMFRLNQSRIVRLVNGGEKARKRVQSKVMQSSGAAQ